MNGRELVADLGKDLDLLADDAEPVEDSGNAQSQPEAPSQGDDESQVRVAPMQLLNNMLQGDFTFII